MDYYFKDYNYPTKIKFIYHISDIHINLQAKHEEYKTVFKNLYEFLKKDIENKNNKENVVIITGDILHSKTELLPECIELTRNFFIKLANIMPVIFIAGNHDMNINNKNRLDALTPIYNGIPSDKEVYYLEKSGVHKFSNIFFCVTSIRDYKILDPKTIHNPNNCTLIALYHGRVNGAELFNNMKTDGEINKDTNKTITINTFDGYDYGLFGDIHKHQYLNQSKTMAYAGSLIQQNHGESLGGHGVIKWNLARKTSKFYNIPNEYGYITLQINNSKLDEIEYVKPIKGNLNNNNASHNILYKPDKFPKNIHLRLYLNKTPNSVVQEVISKLKQHHKVIEISYQDITEQNTDNYEANIAQNITQPDYQNKLIEEYLKSQTDCSKEIIEVVKKINIASNETLDKSIHTHSGQWKLIRLEFSNLYSFGEKNVIDFSNINGIVGIIAPNHMGKSALIDIILYTLYDKFPRKGTLKDIINNRKTNFYTRITFQIGDWYYVIEKSGFRTQNDRTTSRSKFYKMHKNNKKMVEILDEDSIIKTKNSVLKYIGNYDDIIQTNISLQHNSCIFIDSENTKRRKELERILKIDFIDELTKRASSNLTEKKAILKHLEKKCPTDLIVETKSNIKELTKNIARLDNEIKVCGKKINEQENQIKDINSAIIPDIDSNIQQLQNEFTNLNVDELSEEINEKELEIEKLKNNIASYNEELLNPTNLESLYQSKIIENQKFKETREVEIKKYDLKLEKLYKKLKTINDNKDNRTIKKELDKITKEYKTLTSDKKKLQTQITKLKNTNKTIPTLEQLKDTEKNIRKQLKILHLDTIPQDMMKFKNTYDIKNTETQLTNTKEKVIKPKTSAKNQINYVNKLLDIHKTYSVYNYIDNYSNDIQEQQSKKGELNQKLNELSEQQILLNKKEQDLLTLQLKVNKFNEQITIKHTLLNSTTQTKKNIEFNNKLNLQIKKTKDEKDNFINAKNNNSYDKFIIDYNIYKNILLAISELDKLKLNYEGVMKNITSINKLLKQSEQNNKNIELLEDKETEVYDLKEQLGLLQQQLNENQSKFVANNTNLNNLKQDVKTMKNIEKELNIFNIYSMALKQLPYMIIKKVKPILEKKINDLLSVVTDFMVKIEIESTKIEIYLDRPIYNGKLILLNNASGFERFISSLAIRLALLDISLLPKPNFIAIDEGWAAFDNKNIHNVKNIFDFLASKFDFILSISHIQSIREHCEHQINLEKDSDGYSKIKVG